MAIANKEQLTAPAQVSRRRIRALEAVVSKVVQETPDTVTLELFTGNEKLDYEAGHFCTIDPHQFELLEGLVDYFEQLKGKREPPRAYSLASAPHEKTLAITIKEERYRAGETLYPPLLSPLLVRGVGPGARLVISGFTGPYTLPPQIESRTDHLVHLVAGSGSVPNFSILKHALHQGLRLRHTFIYSNRTSSDICYRAQLDALQAQFPQKLTVVHTLTREVASFGHGPRVRQGRIDAQLLRELIPDPSSCWVFACGPAIGPWERLAARQRGVTPSPRFLESVLGHLAELGVGLDRIRRESYG